MLHMYLFQLYASLEYLLSENVLFTYHVISTWFHIISYRKEFKHKIVSHSLAFMTIDGFSAWNLNTHLICTRFTRPDYFHLPDYLCNTHTQLKMLLLVGFKPHRVSIISYICILPLLIPMHVFNINLDLFMVKMLIGRIQPTRKIYQHQHSVNRYSTMIVQNMRPI